LKVCKSGMKSYDKVTGLFACLINYKQVSFNTRVRFPKNITQVKHKIPI